MAHFAKIDENNIVVQVVVTDDDKPNEGLDWLQDRLPGNWVKTSYQTRGGKHLEGGTPLRGNYAGVGYSYDSNLDAFIPPKDYESWVLDEEIFDWVAPVPYPEDGKSYRWSEEEITWVEVSTETE